ncbi:MAG: MFS transporter [Betaproteobacteria bacterium]|nr:MFS transporter [Betaproteobacteria bacterium]
MSAPASSHAATHAAWPTYTQRRLWGAMGLILVLVIAAIAATVGMMYPAFDDRIAPQVREKAATAGRSLAGLIGQAAAHEIPLKKLVGVEDLFAGMIKQHPEVSHIALLSGGQPVAEAGAAHTAVQGAMAARIPVPGYEGERADLNVTIDPRYVQRLFAEMSLDLLVVAVVALFVSLELLYFLAGGLVADVSSLKSRMAAMARGAFAPMATAQSLGMAWSRALEARAADASYAYRERVNALAAMIRARHADKGIAFADRFRALRASIAALRDVRRTFHFAESRQGRRGEGGSNAALVLGAMRAPFFLLLLADDLSRSFLPLFASQLTPGPINVSANVIASLPIFAFMLVVALSQPALGSWSERIGRRRAFLIGAALACAAHLLSALAQSLPALLVFRVMGGAAWAIAFVAAQGYILDHTDSRTRTAGLAAFVGIIMVSMVCGPSIGGILADGIGHRPTLFAGAALAVLSLLIAWRRLPPDSADAARDPREATGLMPAGGAASPGSFGWAATFANHRFLLLLLLAAVPAKVILIGFCFYLIPLYIVGMGSTSAMAGRMIMLYSVVMVLLVPLMANWVTGLRARRAREPEALFVAVGLALSGLAGLAMALPLGLLSPLLLVLLLGIGQSLSISPQAAMVAEVCKAELASVGQSAVYGVYRLVERIGNATGPLIAAALLEFAGFQTAFIAIGGGVLACAALFAIVFLRPAPVRAPAPAAAVAPAGAD